MFLSMDGTLTPYVWLAAEFVDLAAAVRLCKKHCLAPSDFSFQIFEAEPGEELQALLPLGVSNQLVKKDVA